MRLYLDELVDWEHLLTLPRGESEDVEAEVAAGPTRIDIAESLTRRRSHTAEGGGCHLEDCAEDRFARDARLVARSVPT